jgi:hypothetical protein
LRIGEHVKTLSLNCNEMKIQELRTRRRVSR